ncbi:MAG: radical SAM protein [Candidatus Muirbacterium halophilum]|nr:radical SAM protein [Candidatus Muirbacterium halophilum]MCK9475118.1 radical SAM protein [Candidatus Muirbacterium halophilum]
MLKGMFKDSILALEFTNFCNCSCIMCTQSHNKIIKGFMPETILDSIINNIVSEDLYFDKLITFGLGESTLHPQFAQFMEKLFIMNSTGRYFGGIDLHTNGIDLTDEIIDILIKYGKQLSTLSFSIDAVYAETYYKIRRNKNFDKMVNNIKKIFKKRIDKNPRINLQFIIMDENSEEAYDFMKFWGDFLQDNKIPYQINYDWYPAMNKDTIFFKRLNPVKHEELVKYESLHHFVVKKLGILKEDNNNNGENEKERAVESHEWRGEKRRMPCSGPFKYVTVCWNGDVTVCCIDTMRDLKIGNLSENTLYNLWSNDKCHNYRLAHIKGDLTSMPKCQHCNNLDSPEISKKEITDYLKKYGYENYLDYLKEF